MAAAQAWTLTDEETVRIICIMVEGAGFNEHDHRLLLEELKVSPVDWWSITPRGAVDMVHKLPQPVARRILDLFPALPCGEDKQEVKPMTTLRRRHIPKSVD